MYIEDQNTELKVELTKDIKKEIVAFANTNNGTIYIGIDDGGNIIGLKDADKGLKSAGVYLRHGNTSIQASEEVIKKMLIESNSNSFENNVSSVQDLRFEYLKNIFKNHNIEINDNKFKALNIVNLNNKYTNLGLLLSDECPYSIKCAIFNGNSKLEFKDRKEFTGSVLKQVNDTFEYLDLYNKTKGKIIGLERIDTRDYPEYAIRESLLNAVIHRDYHFTGSILISLFDDHFEITSLGGLIKGLNIEDLYNGVSESRNPNLANIFYRLKYVESFGTGIGRIIESYKGFDKQPLILDTENVFKVTLYNVNYIENDSVKILPTNLTQEEQIIEYLKKNNKINRIIVESLLDISKTRAIDILNNMISNNTLIQSGTGKNTYYMLK